MNEPVAWIIDVNMTDCDDNFIWNTGDYPDWQVKDWIPLYTQDQLEEARKLGMQQERALWNLAESTQEIMDTRPARELTDKKIRDLATETNVYLSYEIMNFVRALLRKAQEK